MNDNDNQNHPTTETQTPNPPTIKVIAELGESEFISVCLQKCRDHAIPLAQPSPNLTEIFEAVGQHLQAHRRRPTTEFPDGDKQWRSIQRDLSALYSSIEKIILCKISARCAPKIEGPSEQNAETEQLQSGHSGGHPTGQPPVTGRSTPGHSADFERSTADQNAGASDQEPDDDDLEEEDFEDDLDDEDNEEQIEKARAEYLAQLWRERASRSPIDDLSPEYQKELFELLQEHPKSIVLAMISQPPPLGWGVKTSRPSLKRFIDRYRKQNEKAELARTAEDAAKITSDPNASLSAFAEATQRLVQMRLFQTASDPDSDAEDLQFLCRFMDRQRRTDLSERRVQIAEQKSTDTK